MEPEGNDGAKMTSGHTDLVAPRVVGKLYTSDLRLNLRETKFEVREGLHGLVELCVYVRKVCAYGIPIGSTMVTL